jgi:membrane associated rhomboid family serine protease
MFYFYRDVALRVIIFSVLITGFWVWVMARPSYHIGASGIIYSLAGFLFTSGIIRKHPRLMAISMLVVFIYGGMVWGVFPIEERISWESHFMGLICGVLLAFFFRAHGPQRKKYSWDLEEENDDAGDEQRS